MSFDLVLSGMVEGRKDQDIGEEKVYSPTGAHSHIGQVGAPSAHPISARNKILRLETAREQGWLVLKLYYCEL